MAGTRTLTPRGRLASAITGLVLIAVGIPMLVCPGPGVAAIVAGSGLLIYAVTGRRAEGAPEKK